jgi:MFS family permease
VSTAAVPSEPIPTSPPEAPPPPPTGLRRIGAALHYRDFRVLWFGAFTSTIGTWMQKVAQNWLILTLAGSSSAFFLGLDSFLGELPILLFTLVGGVIADRHDRRQLLLMSQYIQMAAAFTLAALVYFNLVQIWHVLTLSVITGLAQAFGGPAHQSLLPSLVSKEDVPNAIAFNSIQFNLARVIGPLLAGLALGAFGMAACFGLNGLSFLAVIAAILSLHIRHAPPTGPSRMREEFHGGLRFVRERPALIGLAVLGFATTFFGNPFLTFLPLFAQNVFHGDVTLYTKLLACASAGAVTGALFVAWRGRFPHMGRAALLMQLAYALLILLFAVTRVLWLNAVILFLGGICMVTVTAMLMSLIQLNAPNEMRGRVMSIYMVAFRGGMPLGSLFGGWIASLLSAPAVLMLNGTLLSLVAAWFLLKRDGVREL